MSRLIPRSTAVGPFDAETAVQHERHRISCELHDGIAQCFLGIVFHSRPATGQPVEPDSLREALEKIHLLAKEGLAEARTLALSMHSPMGGARGLSGALGLLAYKMSVTGELSCSFTDLSSGVTLRAEVSHCLYRVAKEAIQNAVRHARATQVDMTLTFDGEAALLEVRDNGHGIDSANGRSTWRPPESLRARVSTVGGTVQVRRSRETQILARVPCTDPARAPTSNAPEPCVDRAHPLPADPVRLQQPDASAAPR